MPASANIQANNSETSLVERVCYNSGRRHLVLLMTVWEVKKFLQRKKNINFQLKMIWEIRQFFIKFVIMLFDSLSRPICHWKLSEITKF